MPSLLDIIDKSPCLLDFVLPRKKRSVTRHRHPEPVETNEGTAQVFGTVRRERGERRLQDRAGLGRLPCVKRHQRLVERHERQAGRIGANKVSVSVELQADCFAGVWAEQANQARKILEPGDLEQGLQAASSVGDDTLQRREQGTVVPDSFTHGTSAQRVRWFRRGFDSGKLDNCDTFGAGAAL